MNPSLIIAWFLPVASGLAVWMALNPRRGPGWLSAALGQGTVFGMFLCAAAAAMFSRSDTTHAMLHAAPWLGAFTLVTAVIAWRRVSRRQPMQREIGQSFNKWSAGLLGLAMATLIWRGWIALREILLRPTFPWDAWDAWAVKSKTWYLLGHYAPFVSMADWLHASGKGVFTGIAWSYPATLAWLQVWMASAVGGWIEPMVNLPWFVLWVGLLLGHYGQWRGLGLSRDKALVGVYALGSLPLLDVHVALAGYADLWMATVFGFAVLAWVRWIEQRDRGQLVIAVACVVLMPWLKLEGGVWLLAFSCVAVLTALPRRWRWIALGVVAVVGGVCVVYGNLALPLIALGWTRIGAGTVAVPVIGDLTIGWHGKAFVNVLSSLFAQRNWNLLWWIFVAITAWRWREFRRLRSARVLAALLCLCMAFLLFLFLFTDAARWAESYTAINRLVLHIVPAAVTLLMLLCRDAAFPAVADTAPASVARSDPA